MYIVKIVHSNRPAVYVGPFSSEAEADRYAEQASREQPFACVKAIRLVSQLELAA